MKKIETYFTVLVASFFSLFGILAIPILLLLAANLIDYITALMASPKRGKEISSDISINGIKKKVTMYLLVCVGFIIDVLLNYGVSTFGWGMELPPFTASTIAVWLVISELISILENVKDIGINIPKFLQPLLENVKSKTENYISIKEGGENNGDN